MSVFGVGVEGGVGGCCVVGELGLGFIGFVG